ncbi:hypothetical protein VTN77DRAFT_323 [Rasamsonia byssochlamydoides]|uniref:uncharacterized protein n=1 Tax=Rasamsonia byssochlamydoides TaxID=89139 RepID=UPI003742EF31
MYREKCKKHTQMTNLYNLLKSRAMRSQMQTAASDSVSHTLNSLPGTRNAEMLSMNHGRPVQQPRQQMPTSSRHFNSYQTDQHGIEQLHRHQRSGSWSSRGGGLADATAMPPPKRPFTTTVRPHPTPQHRTRLPAPPRAIVREGREQFEKANLGHFRDYNLNPG